MMARASRTDTPPTVVILLSDKRSGSTIFQTELINHPLVRGLDYSSHTYLESHHWLKAAVMQKMPPRQFSGGRTYPGYGGARNARTYMIDTILGNIPDFIVPEDDATLIRAGWEALCTHYARPVFFEKSPQVLANWAALSQLLAWMEHTRFNVRLVGLIRNPLAVMHSSEKLFGSPPDVRQHGWTDTYRNLLALRSMLSPEQLMILRHEDVLDDPQGRFAEVCDFIGITPFEGMGRKITSRTQDRWKADPHYGLQLAPAVVQIARAFGYSDEELTNPTPQEAGVYKPSRSTPRTIVAARLNKFRNRTLRPARMRLSQGGSSRR